MTPKRLSNEDIRSSFEGESHVELVDLQEDGFDLASMIDPDAVDFEPLLTNISGTAVNYHSSDHPEHQKLMREASLHYAASSSRSSLSTNDTSSARRGADSPTRQQSSQISLAYEYALYAFHRLGFSMIRLRSFFLESLASDSLSVRGGSSLSTGEETNAGDPCRYVVVGMLTFVFLVVLSHLSDATGSLTPTGTKVIKTRTVVAHAPDGTIVPPDVRAAYKDNHDPLGIMDTPVYWHIPRSGGTTMKLIMSMCMGRALACEQGAGHQLDEQLELVNKPYGNFANVDTSTPLGIERAAELGLIPSRMVDVVLTPHVREATKLFDENHKGRLFTVFRDPIERLVSLYYFLRMPDQEASLGLNIKEMTLEEFASDYSENWLVRTLTNTMSGPIDARHLNVAKEQLRRKFLVGLLDDKTETLRRIETYFGWKLPSRVSQTCKNNMYYFEPQSKNPHPPIEKGSREHQILQNRNRHDIELYEYAKFLFKEQESLIGRMGK